MEQKRTFWKMRGHVGFDAVLFKIQRVRVLSLLGKIETFFPSSLALLSVRGEAGMPGFTWGLLWRAAPAMAHPLWELGPWSHRSQCSLWQTCPAAHVGKEKQELRANEGRVQREGGPLVSQWAGEEMKGSVHASEPSLFSFQESLCPPRSRAWGCWGCSLLFVYVHLEETCEQSCLLTAKEMDLRGTINFCSTICEPGEAVKWTRVLPIV